MNALHATLRTLHAIFTGKIVPFFALVFPWLAPFFVLVALLGSVDTHYNSLIVGINNLSAYLHGQPALEWLGQANRVVPITELLGMILGLLVLKGLAFTIRFIKSWIPTIN